MFRVELSETFIALFDGDEELKSWDQAEWMEDPTVAPSIVAAVVLGYTEGPDGIRVRLI